MLQSLCYRKNFQLQHYPSSLFCGSCFPFLSDNYQPTQYVIEAPSSITETAPQKERLTQAVQDILGQTVEVIFKEPAKEKLTVLGQGATNYYAKDTGSESTISSSPLWQKAREHLKQRYGDAVDKSWFSKLDIELNPENNKINIKCPTNFIRGWIEQNYIDARDFPTKCINSFWVI